MRFLHPSSLSLLFLLAIPVALYLFRRKPRMVRVSTLIFFKSLAREHQESAWLRRLKRLLSLLLNILIVVWVIGALARPVVAPPVGSLRSVVVLMDRSASMDARDESGRTRLDVARALVRQRIAGLPSGIAVMVIAYDRRAEIVQPFTLDRREVGRALDGIRVRPIEGDAEVALRLAARLAALDTPAGIWHATVEGPRAEGQGSRVESADDNPQWVLPDGVSIETLQVGLEKPVNAGITAFQLRRLPMEPSRFEAFVQMHGSAPKPLEADLEVRVDGALTGVRKLTLDPKTRERLLIPVTAGEGNVLTLKLCVAGDVLPLDDQVHARVPALRPIKVLWVSQEADPFTELALTSLGKDGGIHVFHAEPSAWPPREMPDVVLFDGWLPGEWPEGIAAIVVDPPRSLGPVQMAPIRGGVPVDAPRVVAERHPLLFGVASGRIAVTQSAVLASDGPLQPLWVGPSGPLLCAGEVRGQRVVVMAFAPRRAEQLPLMDSYPLLFGNAIYWAAQPGMDASGGNNRETGELVALEGKTLTWSVPADRGMRESTVALRGRWTELDRIGLWRTDAGEMGSAALLSAKATRLPAVSPSEHGATESPRPRAASLFGGDLTRLFMWCVLAFLVIESWLFHRHAVY